MSDAIIAEGRSIADALLEREDGERSQELWRFASESVRQDRPQLLFEIAFGLRDRNAYDWAEYAFNLCRQIPSLRRAATFELAVVQALDGRPAGSVELLARLDRESGLSAYQGRFFAHQLVRIGERKEAAHQLAKAIPADWSQLRTCLAIEQFGDYLQQFPERNALDRSLALMKSYPPQTTDQVTQALVEALDAKRPYALVRLNDGEGSTFRLSVDDEARYSELYWVGRRDFHEKYWYGDDSMVYDPDQLAIEEELGACIVDADCLAAEHHLSLVGEYRLGSLRNVPSIFKIVRKMEMLLADGLSPGKVTLGDPMIHQNLLYKGKLAEIIGSQQRIGLVSCYADLPERLKQRFDLEAVTLHKTPGEASVRNGEHEPLGVWHRRISEELERARPGMLYLVAAGITGKRYCSLIKRAGGVALDIGSVADIWIGKPTRVFNPIAAAHLLPA